MQTSSFTVFILSLFLCLSKGVDGNRLDDQEIDSDDGTRIIGGQRAGRVPYQASLRDGRGHHFCGGSILSQRAILTAAHCAIGEKTARVVVGTNLLSIGGNSYNIISHKIHPGYNTATLANDIALLITGKLIVFIWQNVRPISLPQENFILSGGSPLVATGWGLIKLKPQVMPNYLQTLTTKALNFTQCKDSWGNMVLDTNICVLTRFGEGLCMGDSGGPLVSNGIVYGIVSFGRPCALGFPDVVTQVSRFVPWIQKNW